MNPHCDCRVSCGGQVPMQSIRHGVGIECVHRGTWGSWWVEYILDSTPPPVKEAEA